MREKIVKECDTEIFLDKWLIESDSMNWILKRKYGKGFAIEGYYRTLEDLIDALFEKKIKEADCKTLKQLKTAIRKAKNEIKLLIEYAKDN